MSGDTMVNQSIICPECGAEVPVQREYVTWCDQCNWNLQPDEEIKPKSRLDKLYETLSERRAQYLYDQLSKRQSLAPRITISLVVVYIFAALIQSVTIAVAGAGIYLIATNYKYILIVVLGLVLIGIAWLLSPRFPSKIEGTLLKPGEYPELYQLVDRIAKKLGTHIDKIVIDDAYNAGFIQLGWRRTNTLIIGLPLWEALNTTERISLLAHEIGHAVNGDSGRSWVVGSSIAALMTWYDLIRPDRILHSEGGLVGIIFIPINLLRIALAELLWAIVQLMVTLLYNEKQRAEYLADHLAAKLSGSSASISQLQKGLFTETYRHAVRFFTLADTSKSSIFDLIVERISAAPDRERVRMLRLEELLQVRFDRTHPPTKMRIEMINQFPVPEGSVKVDENVMSTVEEELAGLKPEIIENLIDQYRASLYYH